MHPEARPLCVALWVMLVMLWPAWCLAQAGAGSAAQLLLNPGEPELAVEGSVLGYETIRYPVRLASAGVLDIDLRTANHASYFNLVAAGADEAIHRGSTDGNIASLYLPDAGDYIVEIYLMRSAARRNESATYVLSLGLRGPDYADGIAGGPDYWQVKVMPGSTLNVRSGPRLAYPVISRLHNGSVLQNRGCRLSAGQRWCEIRAVDTDRTGWVAGWFLVEGASP